MTVWVDDVRISKNGQQWCHLVADSWEEMHAFSQKQLQLPPRRFHARARLPHYDITLQERDLALTLGAVLTHQRHIVMCARHLLQTKP